MIEEITDKHRKSDMPKGSRTSHPRRRCPHMTVFTLRKNEGDAVAVVAADGDILSKGVNNFLRCDVCSRRTK